MKEDIDLSRNRNTTNGKYVSESHAKENPDTTVRERDSIHKGAASIVKRFRDARTGHYVSETFKAKNPTTTQGESDRVPRRDKAFAFLEDIYATRTAKEAHKIFSKTGNIMAVKNKFGMHGLNKAISKDTGKRMAFNIGWVRDLKKHKKSLLNKIESKGGTVRQIQSKGNESDNKIKQMSKPMGDKYRKTIASIRKYNKGE